MRSAAIDALLRAAVADREVPGAVAAVTDLERTVILTAAGGAADGRAMSTNTVFRVASMTKLVTAVAVMMLVERGRLSLDDPLSRHLPGYRDPPVLRAFDAQSGHYDTEPASRQATLHEFLTHTSGYGYWFLSEPLLAVTGRNASYLNAPFLLHEPGTRFTYGIGTDVLGQLFAPVTGQPIAQFFEEHLFAPLGMRSSGYAPPPDASRLASLQVRGADGFVAASPQPAPDVPRAGGGLLASTEDYLALLRLMLNGGSVSGRALLSAESVARIQANGIGALAAEPPRTSAPDRTCDFIFMDGTQKFGLGVMIESHDRPGGRPAGSYGWGGIYNTWFWVDPVAGIAACLMMQMAPFSAPACVSLLERFERAVYETL
jgi:methyl acetate hydrolase